MLNGYISVYMVTAYKKILLKSPLLYHEIIEDLVDELKYRDTTDFINKAIKRQFEAEGISLEPKEKQIHGKTWEL